MRYNNLNAKNDENKHHLKNAFSENLDNHYLKVKLSKQNKQTKLISPVPSMIETWF